MIPIESKTLRFGLGCFETLKVYDNQEIAFFDEHFERLIYGSQVCGLAMPNKAKIKAEILEFVKKNSLQKQEAILRLILTSEAGLKYFLEPYKQTNIKLKLNISSQWFRQTNSVLNNFKSFNYLSNYLAQQQAHKAGFDDSIILNEKEEIAETSNANLFFLNQENIWLTPSLQSGCLNGIIRQQLIVFLGAKEQILYIKDLKNIKTIIATNSLIEAKNIKQVNEQFFQEVDTKPIKSFLRKTNL